MTINLNLTNPMNKNCINSQQISFTARRSYFLDESIKEAREAYKIFKRHNSPEYRANFMEKIKQVKVYTTLTEKDKLSRSKMSKTPLLRKLQDAVMLYGESEFNNAFDKITWLIKKGSNVNRINRYGVDALSYALTGSFHHGNQERIKNNIKLVETLLSSGAKIQQKHLLQYTYHGKNEEVLTLLAKKAPIEELESAVEKIKHNNKTCNNSPFRWEQGNELLNNVLASRKKK